MIYLNLSHWIQTWTIAKGILLCTNRIWRDLLLAVSRNLDRTKLGKVYSYTLILFSITLSVGIDTTTLSIMTLSITKFIVMTLSITKFSIMLLSITKFSIMILSVTIEKLTLSMTLGIIAGKAVAFIYGFQKCNFVELMQE